jgi:hypothetical protein
MEGMVGDQWNFELTINSLTKENKSKSCKPSDL